MTQELKPPHDMAMQWEHAKWGAQQRSVVVPDKLAAELLAEIQNSIQELGPCDHSVNVCVCPLIRMADQLQAAIAAAKEKGE